TPFFFLADTCWTGPALSTAEDWDFYLKDRKAKGFNAVQFNCVSPWRTAPTDAAGRTSYAVKDGKVVPDEAFFTQLDARLKAINDHGMLAVPVLVWAHKKGDAGFDLAEDQVVSLVKFEVDRYKAAHCLFILAGDARYNPPEADRWKRVGRAVFGNQPGLLVTTHPTGMNWPWAEWADEKWLTVLGYQSGHGDDAVAARWIHSGPVADFVRKRDITVPVVRPPGEVVRPIINLEPPYEGHFGYQSRRPHSAYAVRRAVYWSLLSTPVAGMTYGGHGVWSWHTKPGEQPTDHAGTGPAKTWKEALALPGAAEMGYARKLFESVPWTQLEPAPELVTRGEKDDPFLYVGSAATPDRKVMVLYFPMGARASLGRTVLPPGAELTWFDPRTGESKRGEAPTPPDAGDWVLVVRRR
ncbi:MAG TPA: DUF4038 domain-containing protein, partial [Urbifossiella sp.]|nr:DUF4038 domain-containing protein [Urbifossiella sp.]